MQLAFSIFQWREPYDSPTAYDEESCGVILGHASSGDELIGEHAKETVLTGEHNSEVVKSDHNGVATLMGART